MEGCRAKTWQLQEAKNKLGQVVDEALEDGPQITAATALAHGLVLVTRNVAGFEAAGVEPHDPWA